jgi:hypothetical protein
MTPDPLRVAGRYEIHRLLGEAPLSCGANIRPYAPGI